MPAVDSGGSTLGPLPPELGKRRVRSLLCRPRKGDATETAGLVERPLIRLFKQSQIVDLLLRQIHEAADDHARFARPSFRKNFTGVRKHGNRTSTHAESVGRTIHYCE